ncbi:TetR/AcrR family transcriptional regulator [Actinacidiphila yeochonensis]|uniref:TetR/AcrR family transcriptional regulator n=1 Tax=Actinacidiphila yeochonensis TaxID=89050 RepID=UPI000689ED32|nr:TetR/AcrR family transcriptional regulator [Actinacidiphila yeochonensis]
MQERAARTREVLIRAAAREFDSIGYAGASLAGIARSAGISVGAVTFHFPSKAQLAAAVNERGLAATAALVERVTARGDASVESVVTMTLALADLLENNVTVRAAARLTREQQGQGAVQDWTSAWMPRLRELLGQAPGGSRGAYADSTTLTALASYLVAGVEADLRHRGQPGHCPPEGPVDQLARIWSLVSHGLVPPEPPPSHRRRPSS